ncbi:hypothetical protein BpOF4_15795 [Alkalihalophilus pseudofirmus OF4]|uniref:DUF2777 family protein n=1 Tax=Alkalihalophilus pseudofirmus (strain ATCC BAA-2126 / JCM 17055 / OF4) TaxID=398511 RepID=D3G0P6_ALKPO|nr:MULTISPECIES: DUF2777 domain-containing protein [Alkalihalophilus]ADC51208.1 hypothetical protein BpOF4_15795 [Alkalihalophilus pseudofirmus OF4]MED1601797.1 DUF2777 domain-containing protein [Alkalihalophilus marmarensis]
MDRIQAKRYMNQLLLIKDDPHGHFIGELLEIITEPKKPWRGKLKIKYIVKLGEPTVSEVISTPVYKENEIVEFAGNKLAPLSLAKLPESYDHSHANVIADRLAAIFKEQKELQVEENQLLVYLKNENLDRLLHSAANENHEHIPYVFYESGSRYLLIDEHETTLDLADCPFEFKWSGKKKDMLGYYVGEGIFRSHDGEEYRPSEGETIYIDKKQFDPYFILQNELDPSSLDLFEATLKDYHIDHKDLIDCHNSLLLQLLQSNGQKSFKGVNFLTYRTHTGQIIVQHHYERTLNEDASDHVFDRYEFTSDNGKRSVVTYVSNISNKPT